MATMTETTTDDAKRLADILELDIEDDDSDEDWLPPPRPDWDSAELYYSDDDEEYFKSPEFIKQADDELAAAFAKYFNMGPYGRLSGGISGLKTQEPPWLNKKSTITPLPTTDYMYKEIQDQFDKGWLHKAKAKPTVNAIHKISFPTIEWLPYYEYLDQIGNSEQLLFHGTDRFCKNESDKEWVICPETTKCSICGIIRNSFDLELCRSKTRWARFGKGIYTSACSSKADDYSNRLASSNLKAMVLCRVAVGIQQKLLKSAPSLTGPAAGHHSVYGQVGQDLNYDETVVYSNDAIRPAYVLLYGP